MDNDKDLLIQLLTQQRNNLMDQVTNLQLQIMKMQQTPKEADGPERID